MIASHPAGVIAVRITADRPGLLTFDARTASPLRHGVAVEDGVLRLRGVAPAHVDPSYYGSDARCSTAATAASQAASGAPMASHAQGRAAGRCRACASSWPLAAIDRGWPGHDIADRPPRRRRHGGDAVHRDGHRLQRLRQGSGPRGSRSGPDRRSPARGRARHGLADAARRPRRRSPRAVRSPDAGAAGGTGGAAADRSAHRDARRRRSRARRAALPVRPLPADRLEPAGHPAGQPARASGTRTCGRRGARTTPSTSTPR